MEKKCNNKNPLVRSGKSQAQRLLKTLQKDYVHIDEHNYADLILFAKKFSKHLQYFDLNNHQSGTWEEFFSYDVSLLISFIADNDIREFDRTFQALLESLNDDIFNLGNNTDNLTGTGKLKLSVKNNLPSHLPNFKKLFDFIFSLAHLLDRHIDRLPDELALKAFAIASIQQQCSYSFKNLLGIYKVAVEGSGNPATYKIIDNQATIPFTSNLFLPQQYAQDIISKGLSLNWLPDGASLANTFNGLSSSDFLYAFGTNASIAVSKAIDVEKWMKPAIKSIESVYSSLSRVFFKIVAESPRYLEETLNEWPDHTPHIALYLSFLKLFRFAQNHLNSLKEAHVDFYYKEILRLQERPAKPDEVFAVIELAKQVDDFLLGKDTGFKAGKDSEGKELIYQSTTDTAINKAEVVELKSIYKHSNGRIYASPIANSVDGNGEELETEDGYWKPFGSSTQLAEVGFAIASPNLFLKGGQRTIDIILSVAAYDTQSNMNWDKNLFKVFLTGEKGWIEKVPGKSPEYSNGKLKFMCRLSADESKVIPYDSTIHGGTFQTESPIIKILLIENDKSQYAYNDLRKFRITEAKTIVNVVGLKDIVVQNELGQLDLSNPILPFGGLVKVGSSLIIGSKEVFQKILTADLKLNIVWNGLEDLNNSYIPSYDVQVNCEYFHLNNWGKCFSSLQKLINLNHPPNNFKSNIILSNPNIAFSLSNKFDFSNDEPYTTQTNQRFLRLTLMNSFGQKEYQREYTRALIELAKKDSKTENVGAQFKSGVGKNSKIILKDPPYVPNFKELSLNYKAESTFSLSGRDNFENRAEQFFHLHSFGQRERHSELMPGAAHPALLSQFDNEGDLMIGIKNLAPQQSVSVLFQLAEGSANPLKEKQEVFWSYLYKNNWHSFAEEQKADINDQTNGLLQSGLITFFLPKKINTDNTWLDAGHIWLKASVKKDTDAICNIIDIKAQAVRLQFENNDNAADVLANPLAPNSVNKLVELTAKIKKIEQPYTSFGGKVKEQEAHFHKRVSERLRHKDRAVTIWDIEHLVLEEFPEVYRVKCLNHTRLQNLPSPNDNQKILNEVAPGYLLIVPIPNLQHKNAVAVLRPYTSLNTLGKISDFIKKRISPHVSLAVVNPFFEEIELKFQVSFREQIDFTLYKKILNRDILNFLSPWAFENKTNSKLKFGGHIYKSVILDFVEELPYVDFVTNFQINQYIGSQKVKMNVEEAIASTALSILVSKPKHIIQEFNKASV